MFIYINMGVEACLQKSLSLLFNDDDDDDDDGPWHIRILNPN